jgi:hypothetical protein
MQGCIADEVTLSVDFEDVESMKGGNYLSSKLSFSCYNPTNWLLMFKSTPNSGAHIAQNIKPKKQRRHQCDILLGLRVLQFASLAICETHKQAKSYSNSQREISVTPKILTRLQS